jgi:hypothetical protein
MGYNQLLPRVIIAGGLNEEAIGIVTQCPAGSAVLKEFGDSNTFDLEI